MTELTPADESPAAVTAALEDQNTHRITALVQRNQAPPAGMLTEMKLDLMIEFSIPVAVRQLFDFMWEQKVSSFLDEWESHVARKQLTEGI